MLDAYSPAPAEPPPRADCELRWMMLPPPPWRRICATACWLSSSAERALTWKTRSISSSGASISGARTMNPPALLISTSMRPKRSTTACARAWTCTGSATSAWKACASAPAATRLAATARAASICVCPCTATRAPWAAKACAAAAPMPELDPVISTTLP